MAKGKEKGKLSDRVAVVTGGGRGIGAEIARELASEGADVCILGRASRPLDSTVIKLKKQFPGKFLAISCDVSDPLEVPQIFSKIRKKLGAIDILVNNAGVVESAPLERTSVEVWQKIIEVNLTGTFLCIREVLPDMKKSHWGRIINISSTAGLTGYPYVAPYCAAKHGLIGLTRSLALENAKSGITVNAICPGFTDTPLFHTSVKNVAQKTKRSEKAVRQEFLARMPQGRLIAPEEISSLVSWLSREKQRGVTGQAIVISGGEVLH